ncbi:MAG: cbb3-type cytochrome c oxidase subunit I [Elusimicrobia bacterium]|nr:cbb3-type cytochrome c oxidase subunit I [Elusimicrobiota bacterium]
MWDAWAREWLGRPARPPREEGWRRYVAFTTDHKVIGIQYLVTFTLIFLLAGLLALVLRAELARPGRDVLDPAAFNQVMSMHGFLMIAVAVTVVIAGFGNYFVPLMIGAEDMAFPRLNALSYWLIPPIVLLLGASAFAGGWDSGWTAYAPLSLGNRTGQVFMQLSFITLGFSSILGGINFLATILMLRAPGMTWSRLPIFVWGILLTSTMSAFFTQSVAAVLFLSLLDRVIGTGFFAPERGGQPLLYQHLFWFYSHPAVYIMIIPGWVLALEILPHFARKRLFAYGWAVGGLIGVVALSGVVWAHHMFTSGMPDILQSFFLVATELISIPTGLVFLSALGTIWLGRLVLRTPMLFALAVFFNFLIGGITGIFLADVPTDVQLQDTYFVVAHFHYVIVGGEIFALFAGIYYWFPKITGRRYSERLGKVHFWWMFVTFNLTFLPMFWLGVNGMNRRISDYTPDLAGVNLFTTAMAALLGASFVVFLWNAVSSWLRGPAAEADPWRARTLEWRTSSPPPVHNFPAPPVVVSGPYEYGTPRPHAELAASGGQE